MNHPNIFTKHLIYWNLKDFTMFRIDSFSVFRNVWSENILLFHKFLLHTLFTSIVYFALKRFLIDFSKRI